MAAKIFEEIREIPTVVFTFDVRSKIFRFSSKRLFFSSWEKTIIRSRVSKKIRRERKKKARGKSEKHRLMSGATTRVLQKRVSTTIGDERDSLLWDLIVSNDDICFQHIAQTEF